MNGELRAVHAADQALKRLDIDQAQPVDVYDAIDRAGLYLAFGPLSGILGVSLPTLSGIMVTTLRRKAIQRYTAAHELGHCILHKDEPMILDDEHKIEGASPLERERQAQLFASAFLMPADLALESAHRFGISPGRTEPVAVGRAARHMETSYEATMRRMIQLGRLYGSDAEALLAGRSRWRQQELFGTVPARGSQDVWGIAATTAPVNLQVTAGDQITIAFPENRTTGFRWTLGSKAADPLVNVVGDEFQLPGTPTGEVWVGQQGRRLVSLRPEEEGETHLEWQLARPFDPDHSVARFQAVLAILPPPAEQRRRQILATLLEHGKAEEGNGEL